MKEDKICKLLSIVFSNFNPQWNLMILMGKQFRFPQIDKLCKFSFSTPNANINLICIFFS